MLIGQTVITEFINRKTRDSFPRSLILLGEKGCGKHLTLNMIKDKLNLTMLDITDNLNFDYIMTLYEKPEPYLYIIDGTKLTIKQQNIILKFIEEPLKNAFIVILAETSNQLLNTVYNRCQVLSFVPYTKSVLGQFTDNQLILDIARTPGQINDLLNSDIEGMIDLSKKIINKIGVANVANTLTISDKLAYKDEKGKFEVNTFSRVLVHTINECIRNDTMNTNPKLFDLYRLVEDWNIKRKAPTINQKYLFEVYLLRMSNLMRS